MFPDVYPPRQTCRWIISAPQGHRVQLSFHTFQLETCLIPFICTCDYVRIRDGNDEKSPSLGNFCGGNKPPFIQSSGRFLWVEFVTDRTRNERGFNATYTNVGMKFVFTLFRPSSDLLTFLQSYLVSQNPRTRKISGGGGRFGEYSYESGDKARRLAQGVGFLHILVTLFQPDTISVFVKRGNRNQSSGILKQLTFFF